MRAADALRLLRENRYDELSELCRSRLQQEPRDVAALEYLAVALVNLGRHAEAEEFLSRLIEVRPNAVEFLVYFGVLLLHLGKLEPARAMLLEARRLQPGNAACEFNLGLVLYRLHRFDEAAAALSAARRVAPALRDISAVYESRARVELGQIEAALALIKTVRDAPRLDTPQIEEYAAVCMSVNLFDVAEAALRHVLERDPGGATQLCAKLAQICERSNRVDEARHWLARAKVRDVHAEHLRIRLDAREGSAADAVMALDRLQGEFAPALADNPDFVAQIEFDRGKWLDAAGRHAEAASAFARGNEIDRAVFARLSSGAEIEGGLPWLNRIRDARPDLCLLDQTRDLGGAQPVMLVGFPRSGTTLLDQILDSHARAQVLEEKPLIAHLLQGRASAGIDGPATILGLDRKQILELRKRYWEQVGRELKRDEAKLFIDKNPSNLGWCYFIHHLFPGAKWIYAIRHPLDSILSCYMNRFRYTEFSHGFWSLEETARIYRDVVGYWLEMRQRLGIVCLDLRYEELVENPARQLQALCGFLGLEWSEKLLSFQEHARTRQILTPSYDQVVRPIYRDAVQRWTRYRNELHGAIQIVRPTAALLGYGCD
jgi:tetratricopeptide (TPR) repeat protein